MYIIVLYYIVLFNCRVVVWRILYFIMKNGSHISHNQTSIIYKHFLYFHCETQFKTLDILCVRFFKYFTVLKEFETRLYAAVTSDV